MYDFTHAIKIFVVTLRLLALAFAVTLSVVSIAEGHWFLGGLGLSLILAIVIAKMTAFGGKD